MNPKQSMLFFARVLPVQLSFQAHGVEPRPTPVKPATSRVEAAQALVESSSTFVDAAPRFGQIGPFPDSGENMFETSPDGVSQAELSPI